MSCRSLIETDNHEVALQLLQKLYLRGPDETGTENNGLRLAVFNDQVTTQSQWHDIIKISQEYGYEEVCTIHTQTQYTLMVSLVVSPQYTLMVSLVVSP